MACFSIPARWKITASYYVSNDKSFVVFFDFQGRGHAPWLMKEVITGRFVNWGMREENFREVLERVSLSFFTVPNQNKDISVDDSDSFINNNE